MRTVGSGLLATLRTWKDTRRYDMEELRSLEGVKLLDLLFLW